jgi:deoxyribodipyrimidine photo-lyase
MTNRPASPIIVWFRDLRLSDHPALCAAVKAGAPVIGLFVLDEASPGLRPLGGATRWWLAQSLRALGAGLEAKGASLVLRPPTSRARPGARAMFWNEIAREPHLTIVKQLETALTKLGAEVTTSAAAIKSDPLDSFGLEPHHPDWTGGLREAWSPGEKAAQARLKDFLQNGAKATRRPRPAGPRWHLVPLAALRLWRDQPASGLARRPLRDG